jgi:hypothetical protein
MTVYGFGSRLKVKLDLSKSMDMAKSTNPMTTPDLIEKVARAMILRDPPTHNGEPVFTWEDYTEEARAAIETVLREQIKWADTYAHPNWRDGMKAYLFSLARAHHITLEDGHDRE